MLDWLFTDEYKKKRAARKKAAKEAAQGWWSRETSKPKDASRPKPGSSGFNFKKSSVITVNDNIYVNGKKLTPGTPEYKQAKKVASAGLKAGMQGLDAGMRALDTAMDSMDDILDELL